jgi:hypothetical protein
MPFVLCPNLWQWITNDYRLKATNAARAHEDGILVGFDSPESFEEVFWRSSCELLQSHAFAYSPTNQEILSEFTAYRKLNVMSGLATKSKSIQAQQKLRYLSKNNNNVMRMSELSEQPSANLVLIIRDPLATAWSLYRQHQRFVQIQIDDAFVRAYMRWLGHHEFGQGHKPLDIGTQHLYGFTPTQPDYWLAYWLGTYQNLWQTFEALPPDNAERILWMSHERTCKAPEQELNRLFGFLKIDHPTDEFIKMMRPVQPLELTAHFDHNLVQAALNLHRNILHFAKVS